jgi:two-component system, chemotaxis family, sensor kinase CheA
VDKKQPLREKLLKAFIGEAQEQVQRVTDGLIELESIEVESQRQSLVDSVYRELHNLKGSARGLKFVTIGQICHPLETIMSAAKFNKLPLSREVIDLLLEAIQSVEAMLDDPDVQVLTPDAQAILSRVEALLDRAGLSERTGMQEKTDADDLHGAQIESIIVVEESGSEPRTNAPASRKTELSEPLAKKRETLKISADKLDALLQRSEELLAVKAMARQHANDARALDIMLADWAKVWASTVPELRSTGKVLSKANTDLGRTALQKAWDKLNSLIDLNHECMKSFIPEVKALVKASNTYAHITSTALDTLMSETKELLMMPCSTIFEGFPMLVRDLAHQLGKEVKLSIHGSDIELDKRILNGLRDPLTHLIRNSIDHGIETPTERIREGKPERGSIKLSVVQLDPGNIEISLHDDGRGIDLELVKESAINSGLYTREDLDKMPPEKIRALTFRPSLSTSAEVTEISGRGLGLAIVEEKVHSVGGKVSLESEQKKGSKFTITLPVTIATFHGLLVEVAQRTFVIPAASVERVVRIRQEEIQQVSGFDVVLLEEGLISLSWMREILELPSARYDADQASLTICIIGIGDRRVGAIVDDVLEEQEILVKPLGRILAGIPNVSGLTILGSSEVVPILSPADILSNAQSRKKSPGASADGEADVRAQNILVVDDTLPSRVLLSSMLESAGYAVLTAKDGLEALNFLRREGRLVDLVVTDIEMPNMNGFDLSSKIKADMLLADIPIIIVSSVSTMEHRQRGVSVGADAYFAKDDLEDSNLIEVVKSLI